MANEQHSVTQTENSAARMQETCLDILREVAGNVDHLSLKDWAKVGERMATAEIAAEARGAEEQRRKDAEGQEPVGFIMPDTLEALKRGYGRFIYPKAELSYTQPVYTHPANVAALEARVKVLEEALKKADEFITNGIEFGFIRMPDSDTPDSALATPSIIRAALTREGGEI